VADETQQPNEKETPATAPAQSAAEERPEAAKPVPPVKAILAEKIGMTRVYNPQGQFIPVTVLKAGPCPVLQVKSKASDGYDALQLGLASLAKEKNVSKALIGHFAKAKVKPVRWVREVRVKDIAGFELGMEIQVANFAEGDVVDVSGTIKGKGFAGGVKRHRFRGGPKTHGQSDRWRAPGSLGGQRPQKVFKGLRGPGHMGAEWGTVQRLKVVRVDAAENLLLLEGSVPGPNGGYVTVKATTIPRKFKKAAPAAAAKKAAKAAPAKSAAKK